MESEHAAGRSGIIACSALKESYRDTLGRGEPWVRFVHLSGSRNLIENRMRAREGHFMPVSLLDSQFATLESPADAITLDISRPPEALVDEVLRRIA
jgi:gluconokinase